MCSSTVEKSILSGRSRTIREDHKLDDLLTHHTRIPVPALWLDIFQKIKAMGYNGVSFYADWALLEGQRGTFRAEGIFALEPFFDAATQAGIYLLAVSVKDSPACCGNHKAF